MTTSSATTSNTSQPILENTILHPLSTSDSSAGWTKVIYSKSSLDHTTTLSSSSLPASTSPSSHSQGTTETVVVESKETPSSLGNYPYFLGQLQAHINDFLTKEMEKENGQTGGSSLNKQNNNNFIAIDVDDLEEEEEEEEEV